MYTIKTHYWGKTEYAYKSKKDLIKYIFNPPLNLIKKRKYEYSR